jgi:prevent-host-death family protein
MSARSISVTDASRNLADVVNRVRYRGEEFLIEKGGEPVARLGPVGQPRSVGTIRDLVELIEKLGPDPGFADHLDEIIARDNRPGVPSRAKLSR